MHCEASKGSAMPPRQIHLMLIQCWSSVEWKIMCSHLRKWSGLRLPIRGPPLDSQGRGGGGRSILEINNFGWTPREMNNLLQEQSHINM